MMMMMFASNSLPVHSRRAGISFEEFKRLLKTLIWLLTPHR